LKAWTRKWALLYNKPAPRAHWYFAANTATGISVE
jgi:hypothetical protein